MAMRQQPSGRHRRAGLTVVSTGSRALAVDHHIRQLLASGRTELITGFISKKKKPFDAYLLLDAKGKLSFEFPPRAKKGPAKKTAADNEPTGSA